jgi:predicted dehydrogenase/threonine dehydrogenase-like Zn-dependent dehydrogenase
VKQVLILGGQAAVADVPAPAVSPRNVLVRVHFSCISAGTEGAGLQLSSLPLYRRALKQPENVRRVIQMIKDEGIRHTMDRVRGKLAFGSATGYSAAGEIIAIGSEVSGFRVGDRVACAGAGVANHAEFIDVPVNLAVKVPPSVGLDIASTVTLGAIALQGVRRANPTLGESIVVIGLGLLGQLCAQMLRANGCKVIGIDLDVQRLAIAAASGVTHPLNPADADYVATVQRLTDGFGADAAIICAAGTSDEIVSKAMQCCRRKGRVVLVGDVGLHLRRSDFYQKELDFLVSTSYGPGRYDATYEEEGRDYPISYVRWSENRNMQAYLELLSSGQVSFRDFPPAKFELDKIEDAYASVSGSTRTSLLALLKYASSAMPDHSMRLPLVTPASRGPIGVTLVGAGGFAQGMHLPNLRKLKDRFSLRGVVSRTGANAKAVGQQFGAAFVGTDFKEALADRDTALILIATRHHLHGSMVLETLEAGKHVLVEKPLAIREDELSAIESFYARRTGLSVPLLMTGFNRRFSPAMRLARHWLTARASPMIVNYRMNAGFIPQNHWVHGEEGGGRNIGEACHIYDLFAFLTGCSALRVKAECISAAGRQWQANDNFNATIAYADGSLCTLTYTSMGSKEFPKERMEIFCDGLVIELDDYRSLKMTGRSAAPWTASSSIKGQFQELEALAEWLANPSDKWPISLSDQLSVSRVALEVERQLKLSSQEA